jgi:hypothetical protein
MQRWEEKGCRGFWETRLLSALFACGGLTESEALNALLSFVKAFPEQPSYSQHLLWKEGISPEIRIGSQLALNAETQRRLADPLLKRAQSLEEGQPDLAESIRKLVWSWPVPEREADILRRLASDRIRPSDIRAALEHRDLLVAQHGQALRAFSQEQGWRAGLAAVLLDDAPRMKQLVSHGSPEASLALLAGARRLRVPLPTGPVALLALKGGDMVAAADAYLKSATR